MWTVDAQPRKISSHSKKKHLPSDELTFTFFLILCSFKAQDKLRITVFFLIIQSGLDRSCQNKNTNPPKKSFNSWNTKYLKMNSTFECDYSPPFKSPLHQMTNSSSWDNLLLSSTCPLALRTTLNLIIIIVYFTFAVLFASSLFPQIIPHYIFLILRSSFLDY